MADWANAVALIGVASAGGLIGIWGSARQARRDQRAEQARRARERHDAAVAKHSQLVDEMWAAWTDALRHLSIRDSYSNDYGNPDRVKEARKVSLAAATVIDRAHQIASFGGRGSTDADIEVYDRIEPFIIDPNSAPINKWAGVFQSDVRGTLDAVVKRATTRLAQGEPSKTPDLTGRGHWLRRR